MVVNFMMAEIVQSCSVLAGVFMPLPLDLDLLHYQFLWYGDTVLDVDPAPLRVADDLRELELLGS
jgi:hypothetical protein